MMGVSFWERVANATDGFASMPRHVPDENPGTNAGNERRKIWQAEQYFHCPVAGFCLSLEEQRRLSVRVDPQAASKGDFHVHECVVANLGRENSLSRRADALLARKYSTRARKLMRMPQDEFLRHWRCALQHRDFAAELWAAAVRKDLSHAVRVEVFGASHVAFHELSKERAAQGAVLLKQAQKLDQFRDRGRLEKRRYAEELGLLRQRLAESELALRQVRAEAAGLSKDLQALRDVSRNERLEARIADLEARNAGLVAELERRDREDLAMISRIRELEGERERFLAGFRARAQSCMPPESVAECPDQGCSPQCPSFDLCRKRVLIVGGSERMEEAYRRFVEERGGIFEYHDGRMRGGAKGLERRFMRADVILCPVNCNSHGACLLVKNLGKKHKKPVHMLPGFGLGTVSRAMAASAN